RQTSGRRAARVIVPAEVPIHEAFVAGSSTARRYDASHQRSGCMLMPLSLTGRSRMRARAPRPRALRPQESLSMGMRTGRREWLSMVARGVAASTVGTLGSARVARSNDVGGDPRIKHIVVLMM